ncbi:MAG TPA: SgcJ/EcaC family oxidoreductase [Beutenbergiaceae bacterium]|nr:SgcJ/EcaC family oxidoreductase [Beutenbergiaceae bacterium]
MTATATTKAPAPESASTTAAKADAAPTPRRRRGLRITLGVLATLAVAGGATYFWLMAGAGVQQLGEPECESVGVSATGAAQSSTAPAQQGVCATMTALTEAWGAQDAEAYGAAFTESATYTTWVGTHHTGRADIVEGHRALFDGPLSGTRLADSFLGIELITDDVAVVTTRGDTYEGEQAGDLSKVQTYTMVRQDDGEWLVASFHNTQRSPLMERIQFLMVPGSTPFAER